MRKPSILLVVALITAALATFAEASSRIEKTLKLEPKGRFVLESDVGSVTLTGASSSGAKVVITSDRDDLEALYNINFQENPGSASVTVRRKDHFGWSEHISVHFEVEVPSQTQTEIRTGGGSISLSNLRGDSELKTSGGAIEVSGCPENSMRRPRVGRSTCRRLTGMRGWILQEGRLRRPRSTARSPHTPAEDPFASIA